MATFSVVARSFSPNRGETDHVFLERDNWDDYTFKTLFHATYSTQSGELVKLGQIKIMKRGMTTGPVEIPLAFENLGTDYCSLGQDQSFYETIHSLPLGAGYRILDQLRDAVWSQAIFEEFSAEDAFQTSLLRSVKEAALTRFRQLLHNEYQQTSFNFHYRLGVDSGSTTLDFLVEPRSLPPTNVHAIIGRNGVGKTTLLGRMAEAVCLSPNSRQTRPEIGRFLHVSSEDAPPGGFANVVSVSFSAFDDFRIPSGTGEEPLDVRYDYIGLRSFDEQRLKTLDELVEEFISSADLCIRSSRFSSWRRAITTLSSDPGFDSLGLGALSDNPQESLIEACKDIYSKASAGHRLVLLTMVRLVETVGERTLILFDEPEAHLHPPLLGSFIRALSELLLARNGVAILATHSPVVLQELPANAVFILSRNGNSLSASRPSLETFGESVGLLTHEVFGLEVARSGHHSLISDLIKSIGPSASYEEIRNRFDGRLGTEARSIVLALIAKNENLK
ncbi:ATP-dependent nuclease [Bradyrhizobium japonicum]|uniref:ATP-dependent nuclease n=1 Tax=Bradyrhizobium japonicum TaxID=375 RepID=UPI001BA9F75C|nr:AAA family ATPase [Bradyrhizobium japonicum]